MSRRVKRQLFQEKGTVFHARMLLYLTAKSERNRSRQSGSVGIDSPFDQANELLFVPFGGIGKVSANDRFETGLENVLAGFTYLVFADVIVSPFHYGIIKFFLANITKQAFHVCLLLLGIIF